MALSFFICGSCLLALEDVDIIPNLNKFFVLFFYLPFVIILVTLFATLGQQVEPLNSDLYIPRRLLEKNSKSCGW